MVESSVRIVDERPLKKYLMDKPSLEVLIKDQNLEEIMVNGPTQPVFIYHRDYGVLETNLVMSEDEILEVISDTASRINVRVDGTRPFLDARLADGSRLNATIPPATPEGPTITIRKFRENPMSIVDLVNYGTVSPELAAYLWMFVEGQRNNPMNILVIGGAGSGKTTTLNVLSTFVPMEDRVIVIEDTLELVFPNRKNVVRMESKYGQNPEETVTMNSLLINALRMRPDRLVVGEVRGSEAETLFNAMNVGHSAMGTLHANSPSECVARLTNNPMSVPMNMLPLMDIIIVQNKIRSPRGLLRRVHSVVEVCKSEVGVSFSEIFSYETKTDRILRSEIPSMKEEELSQVSGMTLTELKKERLSKQKLLEALIKQGVSKLAEVQDILQKYYEEPDTALKH